MIPTWSSMWWIIASTAISNRCSAPREKAGLIGKAHLEHVGYGTMNGPDGKPFKTRAGGVMKLYDLIAMATAEAKKRLAEQGIGADWPAEERAEIARKVGIATIKFADLSNHRTTDYIFDLERFSKFEGKTGPYLQYAAVRIQSILRKARARAHAGVPAIHSPEERSSGAAASVAGRCHGGGGGEARAQHIVRLCLRPGAEFQPLLCRASHPVRDRTRPCGPPGWACARWFWRF